MKPLTAPTATMEAAVAATRPGRSIVVKSAGRRHGPINRLVSPGDIGALIKPFVFLDHFDFMPGQPVFPMHPHSGIATITVLLAGRMRYEDSTGAAGELDAGGVEWMQAGNGVWHNGSPVGAQRFSGYQVWVALPAERENALAQSGYFPPQAIPTAGPARVVLGSHDGVPSAIPAPAGMNLLHVRLSDGQRWRYQPPSGHTVAWAHVAQGKLQVADAVLNDELAVFSESEDALEFVAQGDTDFLIGSAVKHPHDLVLGYYSVHTSAAALQKGEAEIERIGDLLRTEGQLR